MHTLMPPCTPVPPPSHPHARNTGLIVVHIQANKNNNSITGLIVVHIQADKNNNIIFVRSTGFDSVCSVSCYSSGRFTSGYIWCIEQYPKLVLSVPCHQVSNSLYWHDTKWSYISLKQIWNVMSIRALVQNYPPRELISAGKVSYKHSNKDLLRVSLWWSGVPGTYTHATWHLL